MTSAPFAANSPEGLIRGIRKWDLVAFTVNAVIGAGIFGLPAKAYSLIGSYSLIAFFACAFVVLLIILCFAEVSSRFDETGGPYTYARAAFGPTVAFEVGWLSWLARLTAFAANCNLMVSYLAFFWPAELERPHSLGDHGVPLFLKSHNHGLVFVERARHLGAFSFRERWPHLDLL